MPKAVSTADAQSQLDSFIAWIEETNDDVIIEDQGHPQAAIISISEYEKVREMREQRRSEQQRREEAFATMRRLRDQISARNQDLTDEEVDEIANRFRHDVVQGLIEKGKVRFEQ